MILNRKSFKDGIHESKVYLNKRRIGEIKSLKTKYERLNKELLDGFETGTINAIAGLSGTGKTTLLRAIISSMAVLNPDELIDVYIFNFEITTVHTMIRQLMADTNYSKEQVFGIDELSDDDFEKMISHLNELDNLPNVNLHYIETIGNSGDIYDTLKHCWEDCKKRNSTMLYAIDHMLLVDGFDDKKKIDQTLYKLVALKQDIAEVGGRSIGFVLSQMNRTIRDKDRIEKKFLHLPDTSCLSSSSAIEQCCDLVMILHMPFYLNITNYTTKSLPTTYEIEIDGKKELVPLPYLHIVKNRFGHASATIPLENQLYRYNFEQMDSEVFQKLCDQNLNF